MLKISKSCCIFIMISNSTLFIVIVIVITIRAPVGANKKSPSCNKWYPPQKFFNFVTKQTLHRILTHKTRGHP